MEQIQTGQGSDQVMDDKEMLFRQKYLRQPNETKEQREQRNVNVRALLKDARGNSIGNTSVLGSFNKGRGAE